MEPFQSALNSRRQSPYVYGVVCYYSPSQSHSRNFGSIHSPSLIPANNSIKEMELSISQIIICSNCYFPQTVALRSFFSFSSFNYTLTALK